MQSTYPKAYIFTFKIVSAPITLLLVTILASVATVYASMLHNKQQLKQEVIAVQTELLALSGQFEKHKNEIDEYAKFARTRDLQRHFPAWSAKVDHFEYSAFKSPKGFTITAVNKRDSPLGDCVISLNDKGEYYVYGCLKLS